MHSHETAIHFDGITTSWEVEGTLIFVELDEYLAFDIVDIRTLHDLNDVLNG